MTHWGRSYRICPKNVCKGTDTVWYYVYGGSEPLGAAVRFNPAGRVNAVFTLGSPAGWRSAQGLLIGQGVSDAQRLYGSNLKWSVCIGYGAMSMRTGKAITSIYTSGESIYGFAITSPALPSVSSNARSGSGQRHVVVGEHGERVLVLDRQGLEAADHDLGHARAVPDEDPVEVGLEVLLGRRG